MFVEKRKKAKSDQQSDRIIKDAFYHQIIPYIITFASFLLSYHTKRVYDDTFFKDYLQTQ